MKPCAACGADLDKLRERIVDVIEETDLGGKHWAERVICSKCHQKECAAESAGEEEEAA